MPTAVITGCNSGIGHAFAELLLNEGYKVHALDVNVGDQLRALEGPNCKIGKLDVSDPGSISEFKKTLGDEQVDVLLNVAGIMGGPDKDSLHNVNLQTMEKTFAVNTFGPLLLTQALLPNIYAAPKPRRVAVVSSRVGSIGDNSSGGIYSYRASKAAVNSIFKGLSIDLKEKEVIVSMVHPGYTNTGLGPNVGGHKDAVEPDVAVKGLWKSVRDKGLEDTGKFWHRDGYEIPW